MAKIPETCTPKVVYYSATVDVPFHKLINLIFGTDILKHEQKFINLRNDSNEYAEKQIYDRCIATLKWARTCGASLDTVSNKFYQKPKEHFISFTFKFDNLDSLIEFNNSLSKNVSAKTI